MADQDELDFSRIDFDSFEPAGARDNSLALPFRAAAQTDPDSFVRNRELSNETGLPMRLVEANPQRVQAELDFSRIDFSGMPDRSPGTSRFLSRRDNMIIARDDTPVLERIEKVFSNIGTTSFARAEQMIEAFKTDVYSDAQQYLENTTPEDQRSEGFNQYNQMLSDKVNESIENIQNLQSLAERFTPDDLGIIGQGVRSGIDSLIQQSPGFAMTMLTRNPNWLLMTMGTQSYYSAYGDARAEGLDDSTAGRYAAINAGLEVLTERIPLRSLEKILTGRSTGRIGREVLNFMLREVATEEIATLTQSLNDYVFGLDEQLEQAESVGDVTDIMLERMAVTAVATIVAGGAQSSIAAGTRRAVEWSMTEDQRQALNTFREQSALNEMDDSARKSKLNQRSPDDFFYFVKELNEDSNTNVYLDPVQTALYLQENADRIEGDGTLLYLQEKLNEVGQSGEDITIPGEEFMGTIAGTDHFAPLRDSMTLSQDTVAPFRREAEAERTRSYVGALMDEARENASQYVEAQDIFQQVKEQLIDTGQVEPRHAAVMADLVPAWATVFAARNGMTVKEVFDRSGLTIEGPQTGKTEALKKEGAKRGLFQDAMAAVRNFISGQGVTETAPDAPLYDGGITGQSVIDAVMESGGTTITRTGEVYDGNNGYVVSVRSMNVENIEDVPALVQATLKSLEGVGRDDMVVGVYKLSDGRYSVDTNVVVPDQSAAEQLGKEFDQEAIWDLAAQTAIMTGGTGEGATQERFEAFLNREQPTPDDDGLNDLGELVRPPVVNGMMVLDHFSSVPDIETLDPNRFGEGIKSQESARAKQRFWTNRTNYGVSTGQVGGYKKEAALGSHRYQVIVPAADMYDIQEDPEGILEGIPESQEGKPYNPSAPKPDPGDPETRAERLNLFETRIKEAGYAGYWQRHPSHGLVAVTFDPQPARKVSATYHQPPTYEHEAKNQKEFGAFLNKLVEAHHGGPLTAETPENMEIIANTLVEELLDEMGADSAAVDWYKDSINGALAHAAEIHPEIASDENMRQVFIMSLALTSNGATIARNVENAELIYANWKETGVFDTNAGGGYGTRQGGIQKGFDKFSDLVNELGLEGTFEFLNGRYTVGELKKAGYTISGENVGTEVYGSSIFGPKIGGAFFQNLRGNWDALTMDQWFMKTWGRITGTMLDKNGEVRGVPKNGKERNWIRQVISEAQNKLREQGHDIDIAAMQALLWYREKDFYIQNNVADFKAEATDYEQELEKLANRKLNRRASVVGEGPTSREARLTAKERAELRRDSQPRKLAQPSATRDLGPVYNTVPPDEVPQETRTVYKLMKVQRSRPGVLLPLFAKPAEGKAQGFVPGVWHTAENQRPKIGNKQLAIRPGIHAVALPVFDQGKANVKNETRVWVEVEMPVVSASVQNESDTSEVLANGMRRGITDRTLAPGEAYDFKTNPNASTAAGGWPIAGSMKINRILTDSEVEAILIENGLDDQIDNSMTRMTDEQIAELNAKPTYSQTQDVNQGPGNIRGEYDTESVTIRLTEASDLSTFLHEFAHFMYDQEMKYEGAMLNSINEWFGRNYNAISFEASVIMDREGVQADFPSADDVVGFIQQGTTGNFDKDSAIQEAMHEQFARAFETYLMEGRAPSVEMRGVFATIANWLAEVYQKIRGNLDVSIDNEMREVFDRMIATDEQIEMAKARDRYAPLFTDAAMAGMTEKEFAEYQSSVGAVDDRAKETLRTKLIRQLRRQSTRWWKSEKATIIDEEIRKLEDQGPYRAAERLRNGEIKLDRVAVKELVGQDAKSKKGTKYVRVPPQLSGMTVTGAVGVHPDEVAGSFGYGSGIEMLNDIIHAKPIRKAATEIAEAEMVRRHGDILNDGTIEQEADRALKNEEYAKQVLLELRALAKGTSVPRIDRAMLKSMAEFQVGKLSYREVNPNKHRKAQIRAAEEAAVALERGDMEAAAEAKLRQITHFYMEQASNNAREQTDKIVERMARYNKKDVQVAIRKAGNEYWEQIEKILSRFEFRKSASLQSVDNQTQALNTWVKERVEQDGDDIELTAEVLNETYTSHWKNVPYNKLRGINDSVRNLEHAARFSNKITLMGEAIDFDKLVTDWTNHMERQNVTIFKAQRTTVAESKKWGKWSMAQMTKIPWMTSWLDGGERVGMTYQLLTRPFVDAQNAEFMLQRAALTPVIDALNNRSKEQIARHNSRLFIPELKNDQNDGNLFGHQVLAVALNVGNQSNLKKMLLGEGWANPEDDSSISIDNPILQAVLSKMTKEDWELVQLIWDQMDSLYPQLAEVKRKASGITPPKIEASPVETEWGTFRGGYYPVKYDSNRSQRAALNEERLAANTDSMFNTSGGIHASVTASATNERTGFYDPIRLSLDVVPNHFQETIHYITHHDAVRQVNKLIRDSRVAKVIKEKLGVDEYNQLRPWLNDIAKDGMETPTKSFIDDVFGRLRFGITLGLMGFKATTGIIQVSGIFNTMAEVGGLETLKVIPMVGRANFVRAFRRITGRPQDMDDAMGFAMQNSKVLPHRIQTMDREMRKVFNDLNDPKNKIAKTGAGEVMRKLGQGMSPKWARALQEASMKHIAYIQLYTVDLPSWYAAYEKKLGETGSETEAFQYADWVVEQVQGSGATKDLASVTRGKTETHRAFTMFMTFFSSLWNAMRDTGRGAKSGAYSTSAVAAKAMFMITLPVIFDMMMRGQLFDEDDEFEKEKLLTNLALFPLASIPYFRDVASGFLSGYGYNVSPAAAMLERGIQGSRGMVENLLTDEDITRAQAENTSKLAGALLGIPGTAQAWATGEHLYQVLEEGEDFTVRELLFGPDPE